MEDMTITDADRLSFPAWRRGRKATVVKYTEETFVLKVEGHSEKDSELKSVSFNSVPLEEFGSALGPKIPAAAIRRSMYISFEEMRETRASRSSLLVTSQGPVGMISPPPFVGE